MSFGKRSPKTPRAQLRPFPSASQNRAAWPASAPAWLGLRSSAVVGDRHRRDRPRLRPPVRLPARPAARPRDPGQRQGIQDPQPEQDQQRAQAAADQVPPSMANDPAADQGPGRPARRPDRDDRQVQPASRSVPEPARAAWKLEPEPTCDIKAATDTPERRDNLHRQLQQAFEPLLRDGVLGPDALPRNEEVEPRSSRSTTWRSPGHAHAPSPRERVVPRADRQARRPGRPGFRRGVHRPRASAQTLFRLVAERARRARPTLTYEPRSPPGSATRPAAASTTIYDTYRQGRRPGRAGTRRSARNSSSCCGWSTRHGQCRALGLGRPRPAGPGRSSCWSPPSSP